MDGWVGELNEAVVAGITISIRKTENVQAWNKIDKTATIKVKVLKGVNFINNWLAGLFTLCLNKWL